MKFYQDQGAVTGFRMENPINKPLVFSHIGEYYSTPRHQVELHSHDTWEFLIQVEGTTAWAQGEQKSVLTPGMLLICPPGLSHCMAEKPVRNFRISFFGCAPAKVCPELKLERLLSTDKLTVVDGVRAIQPTIRKLVEESLTRQPFRAEALNMILRLSLLEIARLVMGKSPVSMRPVHSEILQVKAMIAEAPERKWRLSELAQISGFAPNYFADLFREATGQTVHAYVTQMRLESARNRLLTTEDTVTHIALSLGFSSSQHFARAFQNYFGCTASALRKGLCDTPDDASEGSI